jgi:hypothetical protein
MTITSSGTYVLDGNFTVPDGIAISVKTDKVVIDGAGHEIIFCDTAPGTAIRAAYINFTQLEIKNLTITQGAYDPGKSQACSGIIQLGNASGLNIHDNTININHSGAVSGTNFTKAIGVDDLNVDSLNNSIVNNTLNLKGTSAVNGIWLAPRSGSNPIWEGLIDNNTINITDLDTQPGGRTTGIRVEGFDGTLAAISNNEINVDAGSVEIQGIAVVLANNWTIEANTITMTATHSRAIILEGADTNIIKNNMITMNTSATGGSGDTGNGIRIRFGADNNLVESNVIDATGAEQMGIRIGGFETRLPELANRPIGTVIKDNTVTSKLRAISVEDGNNTDFTGNNISAMGTGFALFIQNTLTSIPTNIKFFAGNTLTAENSIIVRSLGDISNLLFCSIPGLTDAKIFANFGTIVYSLDCGGTFTTLP